MRNAIRYSVVSSWEGRQLRVEPARRENIASERSRL